MGFKDIFSHEKPVIGCIHLLPLPGAPRYDGNMQAVYDLALKEAAILQEQGLDALIIENFRDTPFYPDNVPAETVAALSAVSREVMNAVDMPVGINVLRNDAHAALGIAAAVDADFIRVNVHLGAIVSEQGIIEGRGYETLRLRKALGARALIFADVGVKHAAPLAPRGLDVEAIDAQYRGMADVLVVSGARTGAETKAEDIDVVRKHTTLPLVIGSGTTAANLHKIYDKTDGVIVGSCLKAGGKGENEVDVAAVRAYMDAVKALR